MIFELYFKINFNEFFIIFVEFLLKLMWNNFLICFDLNTFRFLGVNWKSLSKIKNKMRISKAKLVKKSFLFFAYWPGPNQVVINGNDTIIT